MDAMFAGDLGKLPAALKLKYLEFSVVALSGLLHVLPPMSCHCLTHYLHGGVHFINLGTPPQIQEPYQ